MAMLEGTSEAMLGIVDGHNALFGKTPQDIARQIIRAGQDKPLRRRIGQNGYETVTKLLEPDAVVVELIENIESAMKR